MIFQIIAAAVIGVIVGTCVACVINLAVNIMRWG
jgi:hypothetical protein